MTHVTCRTGVSSGTLYTLGCRVWATFTYTLVMLAQYCAILVFLWAPVSQWSSQDLEVGGTGGLGNGSPQRGLGAEPLVGGSGGIASRKLIAVIKDIWLSNHAQFCVFSSTAQPGIFL